MPDIDVREAVEAAKAEQSVETEQVEVAAGAAPDGESFTEVEQEAIDLGWNPEGAEGKRNLSPEEFIERKSFYDEIKHLKKQLKQTSSVVDALKTHNETVAERSYAKAIADLKTQKRAAAAEEDLSAVIAIDEQIEAVQKEQETKKTEAAQPAGSQWDDAFSDFVSDNIWYGRVPEMTQKADLLGRTYMSSAKNPTPEECYDYVLKNMRSEFSEEFGATKQSRRKAPAAVAAPQSGGKPAARSKKHSLNDLDAVTRKVAETLISSGTITEDKYLKDYFSE